MGKATRLIMAALLVLLAASCRTQREAQTEHTEYDRRTDTVWLETVRLRVDSIVERDSVVTVIRGDTVTTDRWHTRWRDRLRVDTVERTRVRTVFRTRTLTVTKEVAKPPSWWQKVLMCAGGLSLFGCAIVALMALRRWKNR